MKAIKVLLTLSIALFFGYTYPQCIELFATSEAEVYELYDRMLDSVRTTNDCLYATGSLSDASVFSLSFFEEMNGTDTIMKFEQYCKERYNTPSMDNFYIASLSCDMPMDFYERFLDYFASLDTRENYCIRKSFVRDYSSLKDMLVKRYESGRLLNKEDSLKALKLIERTELENITRGYLYPSGRDIDDKYMTDKIRMALVNVIKHPFYPKEYYEIFLSYQDTSFADTTNIPDTTRIRLKYRENYGVTAFFYPEERDYYVQLNRFFWYEGEGRREGLSPGQAYLKYISSFFHQKGYVRIDIIEEYAYKRQDELLLKHLKEFKKKHPDYPLKYL
jgi:hypothetical protein